MKNAAKIFMIFLLIGFGAPAEAKNWSIDYAHSQLGFAGTQGSDAFQGSFKNFKADIDFDPDHPEAGKISVTVDIASATTGDEQRDGMLPQSDWFNTAQFPQAHFTSSQIRKTGANAYEAQGTLTIKGISMPVILPFTLQPEGDHMHAQGRTMLTRTDFHIGEGQWANDQTVKHGVDVTVDLVTFP